ncbi:MAG: 5'-nucleotidase C-terminal domain-containing protein [Alphaproteobacteria bacterium]|nr:5'-nucleotidase C-terminal domain-containing protein [Alphaproteobacteria bacterium]
MMKIQDNNINIFALTDCHQEARKLCCLFGGIIKRVPKGGKNTIICDCGDLFKGIYDRNLCVDAYLKLRQNLPEAKIVIAVGNNDFGFNNEQFDFLLQTAKRFNQANIHLLCANIADVNTGKYPKWVDPYILLEIGGKKIMLTAFCFNLMKIQRYGLKMLNIADTFINLQKTVKHIAPDAFIVLNHALLPVSLELCDIAEQYGTHIDLLIGGHEHSVLEPIIDKRIYYPQAFSRTMLKFNMDLSTKPSSLTLRETVNCKDEELLPIFSSDIEEFEQKSGLTIPVAKSILNLTRDYSNPCPLGTFIADLMKNEAKTQIAMISTGYMTHALRYEKNKILTMYNIERAYSAETMVQTAEMRADELRAVFNNALRIRYTQRYGNTRFLQCSQNITVICSKTINNEAFVKQIIVNGEELFNQEGEAKHPEETISCAFDPFIGSGELGFDTFRHLSKDTLMRDGQLVKVKDIFINGIKNAENKYPAGATYPSFKILDIE